MKEKDEPAAAYPATLAVEIEDQTSWPPEFLGAVQESRELILAYQRERLRIDRMGYQDVSVRINPPKNRHQYEYSKLIAPLETVLTRHRIVGYHCTRLTPGEISGIKSGGMRLFTSELVKRRLGQCRDDGHLSRKEFEYLSCSENIRSSLNNKCGTRTGMIWFCPNRSTLQESSGVYRLFRHWGGEAVYGGHEDDPNITATLCRIGTPCIIKCAIQFSLARQFHINFTERFLSQFISKDAEYPEPPAGFDLYTKHDLPSSGVLKIIEYSDPEFEALTGSHVWPAGHAINPLN